MVLTGFLTDFPYTLHTREVAQPLKVEFLRLARDTLNRKREADEKSSGGWPNARSVCFTTLSRALVGPRFPQHKTMTTTARTPKGRIVTIGPTRDGGCQAATGTGQYTETQILYGGVRVSTFGHYSSQSLVQGLAGADRYIEATGLEVQSSDELRPLLTDILAMLSTAAVAGEFAGGSLGCRSQASALCDRIRATLESEVLP